MSARQMPSVSSLPASRGLKVWAETHMDEVVASRARHDNGTA